MSIVSLSICFIRRHKHYDAKFFPSIEHFKKKNLTENSLVNSPRFLNQRLYGRVSWNIDKKKNHKGVF